MQPETGSRRDGECRRRTSASTPEIHGRPSPGPRRRACVDVGRSERDAMRHRWHASSTRGCPQGCIGIGTSRMRRPATSPPIRLHPGPLCSDVTPTRCGAKCRERSKRHRGIEPARFERRSTSMRWLLAVFHMRSPCRRGRRFVRGTFSLVVGSDIAQGRLIEVDHFRTQSIDPSHGHLPRRRLPAPVTDAGPRAVPRATPRRCRSTITTRTCRRSRWRRTTGSPTCTRCGWPATTTSGGRCGRPACRSGSAPATRRRGRSFRPTPARCRRRSATRCTTGPTWSFGGPSASTSCWTRSTARSIWDRANEQPGRTCPSTRC